MMQQEIDGNGLSLWRCLECGQEAKRKDNLAIHIEAKHLHNPGFVCPHCAKFCPSRNALNTHVSRKHRK